jgi:hypothetical protein
MMRRSTLAVLILSLLALLGACGESEPASKAPPGSPENPIVSQAQHDGTDPDAPGGGKPNYRSLVDRQSGTPAERSSPCAFVTKRQAQEIVGSSLLDPVEAPQGPTCIYRPRTGNELIALAIQDTDFRKIRRQIDDLRQVDVSGRAAYCGTYGQPVLYVPLGGGRLLSVNAECDIARGFAVKALSHL